MGWSDAARSVKAFIALRTRSFEPDEASVIVAPDLTAEERSTTWLRARGSNIASADPPRALLQLMQAQRDRPRNPGTPFEVIGGQAVLTQLTAYTISQRVIHHWPDVIGQPIDGASPIAA